MNGGQYEEALRKAPKPMCKRDISKPHIQNQRALVMEYDEWYENEVLPLLRRPDPSKGAPRPNGHRPV